MAVAAIHPTMRTTKKPTSDFRPRRSHEKSRNGCIRCKQQRKKCDEARPICSRCNKRNHSCRYSEADTDLVTESVSADMEEGMSSVSLSLEVPEPGYMGLPDLSPSSSSWAENVYATDSTTGSLSPSYPLSHGFDETRAALIDHMHMQRLDMLSAQELELLSHYITHASRVLAYDRDDLYALHVGIPNLAFGNRPLMASILAMSAACKAHDVVKQAPAPLERLDELRDLLLLADRHHRISLHQIQDAIHDGHQYDHVLANATLMVLYSSSSHSIRVSLAQTARRHGIVLEDDLMPTQSQWITLIRATHTAYTGLLNGESDYIHDMFASPCDLVAPEPTPPHFTEDVESPEDGPSEGTRRFLYPIISATFPPALEKLAARAQAFATQSSPSASPALQACFAALDVLQGVFTSVFIGGETPGPECGGLGRLSSVPSWLRAYLGRATSSTPSKPLRRTIMAFINRVPLEYLHLVQSTLDRIPVAEPVSTMSTPDAGGDTLAPTTPVQRLAMDMFAHWLVLVMLLDGVWWINGIGEWELGRVLSFAQKHEWNIDSAGTSDTWWPESMYSVRQDLAQHIH